MALSLNQLKKVSSNPWSFILSSENNPYNISEMFDTGSLALNAFLCDGDIFGGPPLGKRFGFSGESSTAKSFFLAHIIKAFLLKYPEAVVILYETEGSSILQQALEIGIPIDRIIIEPVSVVEDLHESFLNYIDKLEADYLKTKEYTRVLFALDSLGMLSSRKEIADKLAGIDKTDMTRSKAIKAMYRAVSLKLSLLKTPLITINHTYANIGGYGDAQTESGGSGFQYSGDVRLAVTKSQKKTGNIQTGVTIKAKIKKSRWIKENQVAEIELDFDKGMNRFSHMVEWASHIGMLKATETMVTFNGAEYPRVEFENKFDTYLGEEKMKEFAIKVKAMLGFGASDEDIDSMNLDKVISYGVQFGMLTDTPRMLLLPNGVKIKKNELRNDPSLFPEELIEAIKEKIELEREKETEIASPELQSDNAGTSPVD